MWEPGQELREYNNIYRECDRLYHQIARKLDLSDSAFLILYAAMELGDGCLQKDIAMSYFISKQTINSAVRNLETKGYIFLKKGKRRDMHIYLTPEGQALAQEKIGPVLELENSVFQEMTSEESRQLLLLSRKYVTLFREKAERIYGLSEPVQGITASDQSAKAERRRSNPGRGLGEQMRNWNNKNENTII